MTRKILPDGREIGHEYDTYGLIHTVQASGMTTHTIEYNILGVATADTTEAQDRLLSWGAASFAWNEAGDLVGRTEGADTTTYEYDVFGRLLSVTLADESEIEYLLDPLGHRIGKKVDGALVQGFLHDNGLHPVAEGQCPEFLVCSAQRHDRNARVVHSGWGCPPQLPVSPSRFRPQTPGGRRAGAAGRF